MPTSIWFGGIVGVPSALRTKPSTIRIRVKPVTASSIPGITVISDSRIRIWTGRVRAGRLIDVARAGSPAHRPRRGAPSRTRRTPPPKPFDGRSGRRAAVERLPAGARASSSS